MTQSDSMSTEKTKALYTSKFPFDENDSKKHKVCSRTLLACILAATLVILCLVLTIEFLYPVEKRYIEEDFTVYESSAHTTEKVFDNEGPWHLDFLINPTRLCETVNPPDKDPENHEIKLLMLVPSATDHFAQRKAIRKTWGSVSQDGPLRLGFVLGTTTNSTVTELIDNESIAFGDIIQADFEDTYRNLTAKSILMLKWVSHYCPHAQYFLKADDDTFVNLHVIAQILQRDPYQLEENFIGGFIHRGAQPFRGANEKYFVSEDEFPNNKYPPYASGSAYMSSGPTAAQLFEASKKARPILPMEDIFVTGLCAEDINALLFHEPSFVYQDPPTPASWDSYKSFATAHSVTPDDMEKIWDEMTKSIFDSFGLPDIFMKSPFLDITLDMGSESDFFGFPNNQQGFSELNDKKIPSSPGGKSFSDLLNNSRMDSKKTASIGMLDMPESQIFNLTFFLRK